MVATLHAYITSTPILKYKKYYAVLQVRLCATVDLLVYNVHPIRRKKKISLVTIDLRLLRIKNYIIV